MLLWRQLKPQAIVSLARAIRHAPENEATDEKAPGSGAPGEHAPEAKSAQGIGTQTVE